MFCVKKDRVSLPTGKLGMFFVVKGPAPVISIYLCTFIVKLLNCVYYKNRNAYGWYSQQTKYCQPTNLMPEVAK